MIKMVNICYEKVSGCYGKGEDKTLILHKTIKETFQNMRHALCFWSEWMM